MPETRHHQHQHSHHQHGQQAPEHNEELAELLDLDAEVLGPFLDQETARIAERVSSPARILDLGAGTGTGTLALARRFPGAEIIAVDTDPGMVARLQEKLNQHGLADRITALQVDLDTDWPSTGPLDVVWAAQSMHHMADPAAVLARALESLRPGGVLAVLELDGPPRFLPEDLGIGRPGLERRMREVVAARHHHQLPHLGDNWTPIIEAAGFTDVVLREVQVALDPPHPEIIGRYAFGTLSRMRGSVGEHLDPDDRATLDALVGDGPDGLVRRQDLEVRSLRSNWVATRP
ncbi:methyltransferase domain-containing protein [Nakamurella sp. YIM 132087]|uniref:Methyltransferase domain-containing protein n=1 Tax=Nakamurella alba TaxID=2665158 RepID=A0A7K1FQX4_9ACTN|nr:class I SAM-dependent methyltransferase [Nakamurella alba]MTD15194.1 methyltransferase domain-containing protein [Nakamurella alba]